MNLSAVILAGGKSTRMGQDKAWLRYQGKSLIEAALEKVRALDILETFISARPDQDYSSIKCSVLVDSELGLGPLAGIERALRVANSSLVLVLPVDLPNMNVDFLKKLIRRCGRLTGAVSKLHENIEPLVAVYPKHCHEYALMNMARGDCSVRSFVSACQHEHAVRIFRVPESDATCFGNCNTPQDFAALGHGCSQGKGGWPAEKETSGCAWSS